MVSPQSIAVACAATGLSGREGDLLRRAMPLSLALCGFVGLLTLAAARLGPGLVPVPRPEVAAAAPVPALGAGLLALSILLAALVVRAGRR
jgi:lactate permease